MATRATRVQASRHGELGALERAIRKAKPRGSPVEVKLAGLESSVPEDEVVVLVLGAHAALVSRTRVSGRGLSLRELRLRLAGAEVAVEGLATQLPVRDTPGLTSAEAALLDDASFAARRTGDVTALERSRIEMELLVRESASLEDAATALGVSPSRLRQRLSPSVRTLYGIKDGRGWRIPRFLFATERKLIPGIEKVLPQVRPDAHPLAVQAWLTTPHQDLVVGDGDEPVSPVDWLTSGRPADDVAKLAGEI